MRKYLTTLAALLGVAALLLTSAGAAAAADEHYPAGGWDVRQIGIGDTDWSPASESTIVDATTVELTKPDGTTGTSIETTDLGLAGSTVTVDVILDPDADAAAGAIRLFAYDHPDGDTLGEAPQAVAIAAGSGPLTLDTSGFAGEIGTLGLVYDASNTSAGTVIFKNLAVDGTTVHFLEPVVDDDEGAKDDDKATDETDEDDSGGTKDQGAKMPAPVPTAVPAGTLPDTGPNTGTLAVLAVMLAATGAALLARGRARRPAKYRA